MYGSLDKFGWCWPRNRPGAGGRLCAGAGAAADAGQPGQAGCVAHGRQYTMRRSMGRHLRMPAGAHDSVAIRAGRMFDSLTGQMLTKQVILITGERIAEVGPEGKVTIPAGMRVIDLSNATVLPGFHRHPHACLQHARQDDGRSVDADRGRKRAGESACRVSPRCATWDRTATDSRTSI